MMIQYLYAVLTMVPCPIWFLSRWASAVFLLSMFSWSIYNGSTYYIDVFGKRFQKELEALKADVTKWQSSPELLLQSPLMTPYTDGPGPLLPGSQASVEAGDGPQSGSNANVSHSDPDGGMRTAHGVSVDQIPLLTDTATTGLDLEAPDVSSVTQRHMHSNS